VSGNVSLYNETKAEDGSSLAILPTPAIGGVGLLDDWEKSATIGFKNEREEILLLGAANGRALGQSLWLREIHGLREGPPPSVDLDAERRTGELVRWLIANGLVAAVHDISDGGALVAVAEMALASGIGATLGYTADEFTERYFGEGQGQYIASTTKAVEVADACRAAGVRFMVLGRTGGDALANDDDEGLSPEKAWSIPLADLRAAHEGFFPRLMGSELTPEF
jgi:phosphoribosylformylglycinamidine synthase